MGLHLSPIDSCGRILYIDPWVHSVQNYCRSKSYKIIRFLAIVNIKIMNFCWFWNFSYCSCGFPRNASWSRSFCIGFRWKCIKWCCCDCFVKVSFIYFFLSLCCIGNNIHLNKQNYLQTLAYLLLFFCFYFNLSLSQSCCTVFTHFRCYPFVLPFAVFYSL